MALPKPHIVVDHDIHYTVGILKQEDGITIRQIVLAGLKTLNKKLLKPPFEEYHHGRKPSKS
jgi:hypothetical protein